MKASKNELYKIARVVVGVAVLADHGYQVEQSQEL
jgi:hypothetical protein